MKLVSLAHQCGGPGCGLRPARFRLLRSPLGDIDDIGVRVVSKNTNELKTSSPGRFGIDVSTLDWPMGARILGHEHAGPALDLVGRRYRWLAPA